DLVSERACRDGADAIYAPKGGRTYSYAIALKWNDPPPPAAAPPAPPPPAPAPPAPPAPPAAAPPPPSAAAPPPPPAPPPAARRPAAAVGRAARPAAPRRVRGDAFPRALRATRSQLGEGDDACAEPVEQCGVVGGEQTGASGGRVCAQQVNEGVEPADVEA